MKNLFRLLYLIFATTALADDSPSLNLSQPVVRELLGQLIAHYPSAKISLLASSQIPVLNAGEKVESVQLGRILPNGQADVFVLTTTGRNLMGTVRYEARMPTLVANRRIRPGERLSAEDFVKQDVNVAQGMNYEYRGVMVAADLAVEQFEARQTILEGQYPLRTGIQRVPDVKRGDIVQVKLLAGEIQLSTSAQVQEPGYKNGTVRVLTTKSKKELSGIFRENGTVEVQL